MEASEEELLKLAILVGKTKSVEVKFQVPSEEDNIKIAEAAFKLIKELGPEVFLGKL